MRLIAVLACVLMLMSAVLSAAAAQEIPKAARDRGFLLLDEFHAYAPREAALMRQFLKVVQADPVPTSVWLDRPLRIAIMFPSLETSDAWARLNIALKRRLIELKIPYRVTEFMIRSGEHERQAVQIEQVLAGNFDYVVIGPSEYLAQKSNLERLALRFPTLIMNVVNPFVDTLGTRRQALTHVGFDHSVGARVLCEWVVKETGGSGTFALLRYIRGLIDDQRSNVFRDCVQANSRMRLVAEFEADGDREKAFTGANAILSRHPDVTMIHSGSTAVAFGAITAALERGAIGKVILNGWGGGADELRAIMDRRLRVTPFRVQDDWGVAVAEAIKFHVEGKKVPLVVAATIKIVDHRMSPDDIAKAVSHAFRYSGILER